VTSTTDLPNHVRLLEIDALSDDGGGERQSGMRDVQKLLERSFVLEKDVKDCVGDVVERLWKSDEKEGAEGGNGRNNEFSPEIARCEIILTRAERRALARSVKGAPEDGSQCNDGDVIRQDKKTHKPDDNQGDDEVERPAKRARLSEAVDDSGIGFITEDVRVGLKDQDQDDGVLDFEDDTEDYASSRRHRAQEDADVDMLSGIYDNAHDNQTMLTEPNSDSGGGYSYNTYDLDQDDDSADANKENCPPPIAGLNSDPNQGRHETWLRYSFGFGNDGNGRLPGLDGPQTEHSDRPYDDDEDHAGGSFEPLPLSFDSQAYQAIKLRPQSQVRSWDNQAPHIVDADDEEDWHTRPSLNEQPAAVQDSWNLDTTRADTHLRNDRFEDQALGHGDTDSRELHLTRIVTKNDDAEGAAYVNMDLATRSLGIDTFALLRARVVKSSAHDALPPSSLPLPSSAAASESEQEQGPQGPRTAPQNLHDRKTLRLPSPWIFPMKAHTYMASLDLLQKQVLVRSLRTAQHLVHLVERHSLGGVDLILDPYTAVIFAPLFSLPSQCESLLSRVSTQSYSYKHLLVVFEAYPVSRSVKPSSRLSDSAAIDLHAYTPPILKAVKKFRRDLDIAEACGTKAASCEVKVAFADSVDEAAAYARYLGDIVEERDETRGAIWGQREWLDLEISEVCGSSHASHWQQ
jgi:hypothetical protein